MSARETTRRRSASKKRAASLRDEPRHRRAQAPPQLSLPPIWIRAWNQPTNCQEKPGWGRRTPVAPRVG